MKPAVGHEVVIGIDTALPKLDCVVQVINSGSCCLFASATLGNSASMMRVTCLTCLQLGEVAVKLPHLHPEQAQEDVHAVSLSLRLDEHHAVVVEGPLDQG